MAQIAVGLGRIQFQRERSILLGKKMSGAQSRGPATAVIALGKWVHLPLPAWNLLIQKRGSDDLAVIMATTECPGLMNHAEGSYWIEQFLAMEAPQGRTLIQPSRQPRPDRFSEQAWQKLKINPILMSCSSWRIASTHTGSHWVFLCIGGISTW